MWGCRSCASAGDPNFLRGMDDPYVGGGGWTLLVVVADSSLYVDNRFPQDPLLASVCLFAFPFPLPLSCCLAASHCLALAGGGSFRDRPFPHVDCLLYSCCRRMVAFRRRVPWGSRTYRGQPCSRTLRTYCESSLFFASDISSKIHTTFQRRFESNLRFAMYRNVTLKYLGQRPMPFSTWLNQFPSYTNYLNAVGLAASIFLAFGLVTGRAAHCPPTPLPE